MLVLSRKEHESIIIGDNIKIVIVDIERGKIRIGINAPPEIKVFREEILPDDHPMKRKENETQEA